MSEATTSLVDMLSLHVLDDMADSAGGPGTTGHMLANAYALRRPESGAHLAEELREALRRPVPEAVKSIARRYTMNGQVSRILGMHRAREEDVRAIATWAIGSVTFQLDERTQLVVTASEDTWRIGAFAFLGRDLSAIWRFDEPCGDQTSPGTIEIRNMPLPATVLSAAAGKPLEALVAHPACEGAGLLVANAFHCGASDRTYLELAHGS